MDLLRFFGGDSALPNALSISALLTFFIPLSINSSASKILQSQCLGYDVPATRGASGITFNSDWSMSDGRFL